MNDKDEREIWYQEREQLRAEPRILLERINKLEIELAAERRATYYAFSQGYDQGYADALAAERDKLRGVTQYPAEELRPQT
jgi:hypothetical protein